MKRGLLGGYDDEPQGLFGALQQGVMNPMFLGGAALLSGEGMGGAFRGMQVGQGFQDDRRQRAMEQQQKQQFEGLLGTVNAPQDVLAIARMQGPQAGAATLGEWIGPAQETRKLELDYKRAQIAKMQRDSASAAQEQARKNALFGMFSGQPSAPQSQPQQVSEAYDPTSVGRFSPPALASQAPAAPQTPQEVFAALPPAKKAAAQVALASGDTAAFIKIIGEGPPQLADSLTPGEKRVDQTFAKSYEDFVLSGGAADFDKNLKQLRGVHAEIRNPKGENYSGPILGRMPDAITSYTNPKAVDLRQQVEEIVQRNLRIILGAQFTQKEGENLIARAYNPALDEATNAKRLNRLIGSMEKMKNAKIAAMDYFERNGTMKGFKGTTQFSSDDIIADLDTPEQPQGGGGAPPVGAVQDGYRFKGGNPGDPNSWERM